MKLRRYSDYWCPRLNRVTQCHKSPGLSPRASPSSLTCQECSRRTWRTLTKKFSISKLTLKILTVGSTPSPRCHNSWSPICRPHIEGHLLRSPNVLSLLLSLYKLQGQQLDTGVPISEAHIGPAKSYSHAPLSSLLEHLEGFYAGDADSGKLALLRP